MAGDWIKVELATLDKPEVVAMADQLGTSTDDVIGKLLRVWFWFDSQSRDGNAGSVTGVTLKRFIDRLVASQGFAACMERVGWLTDDGMPNFDRHNGESAKKRALSNERVKRFRNAGVTLPALTDKRREDKKELHIPEPVDKSKRQRRKPETTLPPDFGISDSVKAWAASKGYGDLPRHLEHFTLYALSKGKTYADWDRAFMRAISDDWARLRKPQATQSSAAAHSPARTAAALAEASTAREAAVPMPEAIRAQLEKFVKRATQ